MMAEPRRIAMMMWACFPAREGGAEKQCRRQAVELTRRGLDCRIIASRPFRDTPARESWAGGEIIRLGRWVPAMNRIMAGIRRGLAQVPSKALLFWLELPFLWVARLSFLLDFNRWLRTEEARGMQVFHAHESTWMPGLAVEAAGQVGAVALGKATSVNSLAPVGYDIPFRGKWDRLRRQAAYVAPADYLRQELVQKGIPEGRAFTVPNGVELQAETADGANRNEVLFVGNLSQGAELKAFDILFAAWKQVQARFPAARLNLLGGGEADFWRKQVERMGCAGSVRFLGYHPDPAPFFRTAGCFVLPSRKEGMSNALLEAQAWGLPCLLSDIPANRAVAQDQETAIFVPPGEAAALAEAISRLLADGALCRRLGAAARRNVEQRFDIRATTDRLLTVYRQLRAEGEARP